MAKGLAQGSTIVRVKTIDSEGRWYTASVHYNWENACEAYNATATPKMLTTKAKIVHKQYTNNGFVFNGKDPR